MSTNTKQKDVVIGDFQRNKSGFRIRFYWFAGVFTFTFAVIAVIAAWKTIVFVTPILVYGIVAIAAIFAITHLVKWGFEFSHWIRREAAQTRQQENQSRIITHNHNDVAYMWNDGNLLPVYVPKPNANLLPATIGPSTPDFLDFFQVMTQSKRVYSIVADQQTGKTFLSQHIASYWMQKGVKPVVISQKYDTGEYANCEQLGPDSGGITTGFELVKTEADYRQQLAQDGIPFGEMKLQPVFLEDFTSLYTIIGRSNLESFVAQALTVYAARGLLLYFVAHSRTKDAFGLSRAGASLKDQMTRLEIIPAYTSTGEVDHSRKDVICSIGSNIDSIRVTGIPTHTPQLEFDCQLALYSLALPIAKPESDMTPTEGRILMLDDRGRGISEIALIIFGGINSHNTGRVKTVLEKYGREVRDKRKREDVQL